jgi:hypothetical protein
MSEELLSALGNFRWDTDDSIHVWRIYYDPASNGTITHICPENQTGYTDPYIEVTRELATSFIDSNKYQREYQVINEKLELKITEHNVHKASDARVNQITLADDIESGVYFVTVRGEPDLVIDTIEVTADNTDAESKRIIEYLENNDVYKDSE